MIAWLSGHIIESDGASIVLNVNGVGYHVFCSKRTLSTFGVGEEITITVFTEVREDAIKLYGFCDKLEKQVFILLTLVKGIGPKSSLDILSRVDPRELLKIIGQGDLTRLQAVKGIGKKTAERIVVELKDKVGEYAIEQQWAARASESHDEVGESLADAISALQALGFAKKDAERAVEQVKKSPGTHANSGAIVGEALKYI